MNLSLIKSYLYNYKNYATVNTLLPICPRYALKPHIGKIAEENPDLSYNFIKEILFSLDEAENGNLESYVFSER